MTLESINQYLDTLLRKGGDLSLFSPEIVLCGTIVAMLLLPLVIARPHLSWVALAGSLMSIYLSLDQWVTAPSATEIFQGLLVVDQFTIYFRLLLLTFLAFVIVLTMLTGIPDAEDSADFYTLLLGSVVGMMLMASTNSLLMAFLSVEMASVPSYALAGFLKGRKQSSEAALKYVVYGGAAAGVMLYGLTLLAGLYGTLHLPTVAVKMLEQVRAAGVDNFNPVLLLALMLILVGLAFKLAATPFHFWCPDVFEGASAEVAAFLSVASKAAAIALVARFTGALVGVSSLAGSEDWTPAIAAMGRYLSPTIAVMAAVTCTFGNLAAYGQTNLKRLLAYSTIAHAGYMMMALAPLRSEGIQAALFYLIAYLFMNLGAFAVVAFVRNKTGKETIDAFRGLIYRAPVLTVAMCVFLLSLTGMPPFVGFVGKFFIFKVLYQTGWYSLLVVGGLNTVLSLVYYVGVIRDMILRGEPTRGPSLEGFAPKFYVAALAIPTLALGIFFQEPLDWSIKGARALKPDVTYTVEGHPNNESAPSLKLTEVAGKDRHQP